MIDISEELYKFNPWWETSYKTSLIDRQRYRNFFNQNIENKDVIIITGLRRVGKTSLMKMFISELLKSIDARFILYASLDSISLEKFSTSEIIREYRKIHGLRLDQRVYLFLDEIGYRKRISLELKNLYDAENVKIYASSSSTSISISVLLGKGCIIIPFGFKRSRCLVVKVNLSESYDLDSSSISCSS